MSKITIEKLTKVDFETFKAKDKVNPLPYLIKMINDDSEGTEYSGGAFVTSLPVPSTYSCAFKELCNSAAGRTEDMKMNKMVIGKYAELGVTYVAMETEELSELLKALKDEYITLMYFNPLENEFQTKIFYGSEKNVPMYNGKLGIWDKLSITFTQRTADSVYAQEPLEIPTDTPSETPSGDTDEVTEV